MNGGRYETSPENFLAPGRRRCRAVGRIAHRVGASLSGAPSTHHRRLSRRGPHRHRCARDGTMALGASRPPIRRREPRWRCEQYRHRGGSESARLSVHLWDTSSLAEEFFQHALVFDRSSLTRWRQRMGEDKLKALLQESLAVATRTEAMKPSDLARVVIDTTVQPKAVMFPTDAKLLNRARERLVRLTKKLGVSLRQSY